MFSATPDSLISLHCGDVPLYTGKMGRKGNMMSVRIEEKIEKKPGPKSIGSNRQGRVTRS